MTCRNRKIKCDRNFPCNKCIKSERDCRYDTSTVAAAARPTGVTKPHAPPGGHHHATKTESDLQRRITRLEEMLTAGVEKMQKQPTVDLGIEVLPRAASQLQITEGRTRYLGPLAWIAAVENEVFPILMSNNFRPLVLIVCVDRRSEATSAYQTHPTIGNMANPMATSPPLSRHGRKTTLLHPRQRTFRHAVQHLPRSHRRTITHHP